MKMIEEHRNLIVISFIFFFFLALLCSMQDLSSPVRDQSMYPEVDAPSLNDWICREVP